MSNVEQEKKFCYLLASSTKIHHYRSPVNKFCMSTVQVKGKTVALSRILVDCLKQSSMHVNHMDSKRISTFSSFRQKQKCIYYTTCFMWCKILLEDHCLNLKFYCISKWLIFLLARQHPYFPKGKQYSDLPYQEHLKDQIVCFSCKSGKV